MAAISLARAPSLAPAMQDRELPSGMPDLLKIFARDEAAIAQALIWAGGSREELVASVDVFVFKVVLFAGANPARMLASDQDAKRHDVRANLKLLLAGLHPDKTGDSWRAPYAQRVIEAWRSLSATSSSSPQSLPSRPSRYSRRRVPWVARPVPKRRAWKGYVLAFGLVAVLIAAGGLLSRQYPQWRLGEGLSLLVGRLFSDLPCFRPLASVKAAPHAAGVER